MSFVESSLIWFVSFLILCLILFISYKISYKLGIKKALYRTTYILLSVIFAFILAPLVNTELFKMDLRRINITLYYEGEPFYTIIDYIEEVIVHSSFLNDIYTYFPSLKDLFMDFPEVILAPVTFVLLFVLFLIIWLPLYLYLSYKRKRRILYDREDKKSHRVCAGLLGMVQCVFIVSIVLTPINGFNRIYHSAIQETLDDEYHSLCQEVEPLKQYSRYCNLIDIYDSTILANMGGKGTADNYMFDALTRINYEDEYTNIENEATIIMKSSILMDQTGIFEILVSDSDVLPLSWIMNNKLTDEDIDMIVNTLKSSKYSAELLTELRNLVVNTLNGLLEDLIGYEELDLHYSMTSEELLNEIKVVLKAIRLIGQTDILNEIIKAKDVIFYFAEEVPQYAITDGVVFGEFIVDLVNSMDMDDFELFFEYLYESKIFYQTIPYIIDMFFGEFGFSFARFDGDVMERFYDFWNFGRLVKKYQPVDFFHLMYIISDEDLLYFAKLFDNVASSPETAGFIEFIFSGVFMEFDLFFLSDLFTINNWDKEAFVIRDFCVVLYYARQTGIIDVKMVAELLMENYKDSQVAKLLLDVFQNNLKFFMESIILGEKFE